MRDSRHTSVVLSCASAFGLLRSENSTTACAAITGIVLFNVFKAGFAQMGELNPDDDDNCIMTGTVNGITLFDAFLVDVLTVDVHDDSFSILHTDNAEIPGFQWRWSSLYMYACQRVPRRVRCIYKFGVLGLIRGR